MSEITKLCESCAGEGVRWYDGSLGGCNGCSGTSRVPDVEGQLRAEVARLTEHVETLGAALKATAGDVVHLTAAVALLREVVGG